MKTIEFTACGAPVIGYIHEDHDCLGAHKVRPALIVCPGGAYRFVCPREADPPALAYFSIGYNVFILTYSVMENAAGLRPLKELARTVSYVREHSTEWHIEPQKIAVMGFSAGGHLAASLGALWNNEQLSLEENCRPDAVILGYPVITLFEHTHQESSDNVSGGDDELRRLLTVETHVTAEMPPVFVWHTVDDPSVPVENTLLLVSAMQKCGVPYECHLFAHGAHGLSTCNQEVETPNAECAEWLPLSKTWLNNLFQFVE